MGPMTDHSERKGAGSPTFVARLWLEQGPNSIATWRGRVRHVQGDREAYFRSFGQLRAFLQEVSGVPGPTDENGTGS